MKEQRQKLLVAVLGLIVLYYGGDWAWTNIVESRVNERTARAADLQKRILTREALLLKARQERALVAAWEARSLPADPQVARSLYQAWLLELIDHVGFSGPSVNSGEPSNYRGLYQSITFSLRARGSLEQLVRFLFEFYNAGHLHQIRSLAISPLPKTGQLDLSIAIEGLILPTAANRDQLASLRYNRLAYASLDDYRPIVRRNFFSAGAGMTDPTDFAFLTGVNYVNGEPQAWFTLRSEDRVIRLGRGDELEVGQFSGAITQIDPADVVLESEGERWLLTVGESLAEAFALPEL